MKKDRPRASAWRSASADWKGALAKFVLPQLEEGESIAFALPVDVGPSAATMVTRMAYSFLREGILALTKKRVVLVELGIGLSPRVQSVHSCSLSDIRITAGLLRRPWSRVLMWPNGRRTRVTVSAWGENELKVVERFISDAREGSPDLTGDH